MRRATRWTLLASVLCGCASEPYDAVQGGALTEPPAGKNYVLTPEGSASRVAVFGAWAEDLNGLLRDMRVASPGWMPGDFMTIPTAHGTLVLKDGFTCVERPRGRSQCEFVASTLQEENGTIRFGRDPRISALDVDCKAHELDNLYVVDGSFFPSSGAVNPALTIIANALRVGDRLLERMR